MGRLSKRNIKNLFGYSRSDRNAILILAGVLLLIVVANSLLEYFIPKSVSDFTEIKKKVAQWEKEQKEKDKPTAKCLFHFDPNKIPVASLDSLSVPSFIKRNIISYRKAGGTFKNSTDVRKIYGMNDSIFYLIEPYIRIEKRTFSKPVAVEKKNVQNVLSGFFDPNSADNNELQEFGFNNFQAKNLLAYRSKGGSFKEPVDLLKIYGVDSVFFRSIQSHIKIEEIVLPPPPEAETFWIELNTADTADLIQLPGIGPSYATRIIKYRNLLGGYYSKDQLLEVYHFPEGTYNKIEEFVYTDTTKIEKLRLNFSDFSELLRHPYLNKEHVKEMLNRRDANGPYKNFSDVRSIKSFDSETISKIRPYITCR